MREVDGDVWKDGDNFLTTCPTIDGEWSAPVYLNSSGFDASLFHDDDGRKYLVNMVWDYRVANHRFYGIVCQEYDHAQGKLIGKPTMIFKGTDLGLTEAPHLYKIDGWYYLLTAEGGTSFEHAATIARSRRLLGPYETHPENPLISSWAHPRLALQKAGHASIVQAADGQWYLAHLCGRPIKAAGKRLLEGRGYCPLGRETAIQKLEWREGWPYVVGGNWPALTVDGPNAPSHPWPAEAARDDFDSPVLADCFQTLRAPFTPAIGSLTDKPGYLRLFGRESLFSTFTQAVVARRWESLDFDAETSVCFEPETFQQTAGLVCYYCTKEWLYLFISADEAGKRVLSLYACDGGGVVDRTGQAPIALPDAPTPIRLSCAVRGMTVSFAYSVDGKSWQTVGSPLESWKLSDDRVQQHGQGGFFTGAFVGVCCQDMTGQRRPADFDYFDYRESTKKA